jgi:hypothetical protein
MMTIEVGALSRHDRADREGRVRMAPMAEGAAILNVADFDMRDSQVPPIVRHRFSNPSEQAFLQPLDSRVYQQDAPVDGAFDHACPGLGVGFGFEGLALG